MSNLILLQDFTQNGEFDRMLASTIVEKKQKRRLQTRNTLKSFWKRWMRYRMLVFKWKHLDFSCKLPMTLAMSRIWKSWRSTSAEKKNKRLLVRFIDMWRHSYLKIRYFHILSEYHQYQSKIAAAYRLAYNHQKRVLHGRLSVTLRDWRVRSRGHHHKIKQAFTKWKKLFICKKWLRKFASIKIEDSFNRWKRQTRCHAAKLHRLKKSWQKFLLNVKSAKKYRCRCSLLRRECWRRFIGKMKARISNSWRDQCCSLIGNNHRKRHFLTLLAQFHLRRRYLKAYRLASEYFRKSTMSRAVNGIIRYVIYSKSNRHQISMAETYHLRLSTRLMLMKWMISHQLYRQIKIQECKSVLYGKLRRSLQEVLHRFREFCEKSTLRKASTAKAIVISCDKTPVGRWRLWTFERYLDRKRSKRAMATLFRQRIVRLLRQSLENKKYHYLLKCQAFVHWCRYHILEVMTHWRRKSRQRRTRRLLADYLRRLRYLKILYHRAYKNQPYRLSLWRAELRHGVSACLRVLRHWRRVAVQSKLLRRSFRVFKKLHPVSTLSPKKFYLDKWLVRYEAQMRRLQHTQQSVNLTASRRVWKHWEEVIMTRRRMRKAIKNLCSFRESSKKLWRDMKLRPQYRSRRGPRCSGFGLFLARSIAILPSWNQFVWFCFLRRMFHEWRTRTVFSQLASHRHRELRSQSTDICVSMATFMSSHRSKLISRSFKQWSRFLRFRCRQLRAILMKHQGRTCFRRWQRKFVDCLVQRHIVKNPKIQASLLTSLTSLKSASSTTFDRSEMIDALSDDSIDASRSSFVGKSFSKSLTARIKNVSTKATNHKRNIQDDKPSRNYSLIFASKRRGAVSK